MWRKRQVEQLMILEQEREMDKFLTFLLNDTELDIDAVRCLFLDQYPEEQPYMESFINDYIS